MSQDEGLTSNPWPSSDWVAFLSERGIPGFVLLLGVMLGLLWRAVRDLRGAVALDGQGVLTAIALVGTLVAAAVVGAFDAVLLVAVPTFFLWTLAGALAPPAEGGLAVEGAVARTTPAVVFGVAVLAITRSAMQLVAIALFSTSSRVATWDQASLFDPGNYRIHTRTAQAYIARGNCRVSFHHARAARALFPNAAEPRRELGACGNK